MYVLGIDVGTTGTKALLIDETGHVCGRGYKGYGLITGAGGVVEQNADDWWTAAVSAVREAVRDADKSRIVGLSLSTQGASAVLLDAAGRPVGNAITWMDGRATAEKTALETSPLGADIYRKTGWRLNESLDAAKLLWYKNHRRDVFDSASGFVSTIEYMNLKLTGENVVDPANAAIRQMMDISTSAWDEEILSFIGFPTGKLPAIAPTGTMIGLLTPAAAQELGLSESVRVYLGAHDQYCAALGAGLVEKGQMVLSTGTAWVMLGLTARPMFTPSFIAPARHIVDGLWGAMASVPVAGASLDWFRKIADADYDAINAAAASRRDSARNLLFYPYFIGSKYPLWQSDAKACFMGLTLEHDRFDMFRAVMEGVAFQLKLGLLDYKRHGARIDRLIVTGGATKSPLWLSIISAVTGVDMYRSEETDAACVGAAIIAGVNAGIFESYQTAVHGIVQTQRVPPPRGDEVGFYRDKYRCYTRVWDVVSDAFGRDDRSLKR